jgi:hypothetical protein
LHADVSNAGGLMERSNRRRCRHPILIAIVVSIVAVAAAAPAASAQDTTGAAVSGVVFDSVSRRPLANADVELADAAERRAITRRVRTDAAGRFEMSNVRPGRYLVGFYHPLLDSLSLELPTRTIEVAAAPVRVSLAVPSLTTIAAVLCPSTYKDDSTATLIGRVYDAETLGSVAGGEVSLLWREFVVAAGGGIRQRQPRASAATSDDGGFAFCGVPAKTEFGVTAIRGADSTDLVSLIVPPGSVFRRDLFVGRTRSTDSAKRSMVLRGRVVTTEGRALSNASVAIARAGQVARTDDDGRFEATVAASGTQRVEFRHLGYGAASRLIDLVAGRSTSVDVTLVSVKQLMDTVKVLAARVYDADSEGFQRRRKSGLGYYFGPEDVGRLRVGSVSELFSRVPSVRIMDLAMDRVVMMRDHFGNGDCQPTIFIDGMRVRDLDVTDIDVWVPPQDLAGLEVYTTPERAPMEFTTLDGCGALVFWTRRAVGKRRESLRRAPRAACRFPHTARMLVAITFSG